MLQKIRDKTEGLASKVILYVVIAVFALWGLDSLVGSVFLGSKVVEVNGTKLSDTEIERMTQQKIQEYFANLAPDQDPGAYDENLMRANALEELIQRELLRQVAKDSGMVISSDTIDRRIAVTPDFQVDGVFNAERASILLRSMGYSPAGYRALLAQETLLNQQLATYTTTGFATRADIERIAALSHQKRSFRFLTLPLDAQGENLEISDEDIAAYYNANELQFMREEQVKLDYLELDKNALFAEVAVNEDAILAAYNDEVSAYQAQTERRASHILFGAASEEEFAAADAKAREVKARLDAGEDFGALAQEFSDDTGSAQDGGDVGYTTGSNFVANFEQALQGLALDQVSDPVRTEFGVHLIKLTEVSETEVPSFEERRADIERTLKAKDVDVLFSRRVEELGNLAFESFDLSEPAMQMNLEIQHTDWFGRSGGAGIAGNPAVIQAAFGAEVLGEQLNSATIQVDANRTVVVRVAEHQDEELRPLDEVRGEIEVLLRIDRLGERARVAGEGIVNSLKAGDNIDQLLQVQDLAWNQQDNLERNAFTVNPEVLAHVFSVAAPAQGETLVQGFQTSNGDYVVFELQSVVDGTAADFRDGEQESLRNFISQQSAANDFAGFMLGLEARAKIVGKQSYLQSGGEDDFDLDF
ncbi:MAG TPA: SurA N-terminal domain-containing protein [Hyphomicrobiales bacterium]|nr:SurA N-terminal domain-containing protein [Hyphomicrobiales bacterium]